MLLDDFVSLWLRLVVLLTEFGSVSEIISRVLYIIKLQKLVLSYSLESCIKFH